MWAVWKINGNTCIHRLCYYYKSLVISVLYYKPTNRNFYIPISIYSPKWILWIIYQSNMSSTRDCSYANIYYHNKLEKIISIFSHKIQENYSREYGYLCMFICSTLWCSWFSSKEKHIFFVKSNIVVVVRNT